MTSINQRGRYGQYIQVILTLSDFLIINIAYAITAKLAPSFVLENARMVWLMANIAYLPAAYLLRHTQTSRSIAMEHVVSASIKALLLHAPVFICGLYFLEIGSISWTAMALFYGLLVIMLPLWWVLSRLIIKYFRRRGRNYSRIVIVGSNPTTRRLCEIIGSDLGFGYAICGVFDDSPTDDIAPDLYRGTISDLKAYIKEHKIDEVYCTLDASLQEERAEVIRIAEDCVAQVYIVPQLVSLLPRNYEMFAIGSMPVLGVLRQPLAGASNRVAKRVFDIAVSSLVLLFFPLVLIPVGIAIKISSPGPIFFRQERTGYRGRTFKCFKFRTMVVNEEADKTQTTKNDSRKTRVGEFLRHSSIDELPQFINVFIGDMSVVGPRPHMLAHTEQYAKLIQKYMVRHYIKPGITGWAQINGLRGQTEELWQMEQRVEHDVWYIENWNIWLDIKIMFRTVYNAVRGEENAF
ncbi:MAG: undecaprenyl-phosphate glucose phosphotransferase [Paramuribaculum sp.]|nr:undecaprenyl-phosphate glucose phosphotransferase [Paramuribaculum sp.]